MATKQDDGGGFPALILVFVGAVGFAACVTGVYRGMRDLMITAGGSCASGGPYEVAAGHQCTTGQSGLLVGGILVGLVFAGIFAGASGWYGDTSASMAAGMFMWAALFGALGLNFIQLGLNPPAHVSGGAGWIICGVVFWAMALGGLIPGLWAFKSFINADEEEAEEAAEFESKIVRANVDFVRSMPGDPMYGQTHVTPQTAGGPTVPANPVDASTAPEVRATNDFIDPVTGEKVSRDD